MAKSTRKVSLELQIKSLRKWINHILLDLGKAKEEVKELNGKVEKLEERVKTLEQGCKCSGNSSS